MKRKIAVVIVVICILASVLPITSRAAVVPYFIAVKDTLLPFNDDTMPYISGGEIFVPHRVFSDVDVWSLPTVELERVRLYRANRYVDCFTGRDAKTVNQDESVLPWPATIRVGGRFYVPLRQVCDYFGLSYTTSDLGDIVPQEQMRLIRIIPAEGFNGFNDLTFLGYNRNALRNAYNSYYSPQSPPPSTDVSPGVDTPPPSVAPPPPKYDDVTIYHSFYDISADGVDTILELLDNTAENRKFCFFVSADDVKKDAGLIRMISADGHSIGIWLFNGTYDEYLKTSALLFEATKLKTVLVSAESETVFAIGDLQRHGLIFWEAENSLVYDDTLSVESVTEMISTDGGTRQNLISSCSENTALMLSGILSYLREYEYSVVMINETVKPILTGRRYFS